jgi:hypothetical protein
MTAAVVLASVIVGVTSATAQKRYDPSAGETEIKIDQTRADELLGRSGISADHADDHGKQTRNDAQLGSKILPRSGGGHQQA